MTDNRKENRANFCFWQAESFIDYSSKLQIKDKDNLLSSLRHWADGKQLLEQDAKYIEKLVLKYWEEKEKEMAKSKRQKQRSSKKVEEADKRQLRFGLDS